MIPSSSISQVDSSQIVPFGVKITKEDLPINALILYGQAKKNCEIYCGSDTTERIEIYKEKHPKEYKKHCKKNSLTTVLLEDKKTNSLVMSLCTSIVGGLGSLGWLAGPIGGAPGTTLGIAGGMMLGGVIIKHLVNERIDIALQVTDHYVLWLSQNIVDIVYPVFKNFINTDEEYQDLLCPISLDVCSVPVKAPDGRTYNLKDIAEYIEGFTDKDDVKVVSPIRNGSFSKLDLYIDHDYCKKIIDVSDNAFYKVRCQSRSNQVSHGKKAVIAHTKHIMSEIKDQVAFAIWKKFDSLVKAKKMSEAERSEHIVKATAQWDFEATNNKKII